MRAIQVRCPHCGASLATGDDAASVTCAYCGTVSRVQTRSRIFQVPQPLPPEPAAPASRPRPVARQRIGALIALPILIVVAAALVPVIVAVSRIKVSDIKQLAEVSKYIGPDPSKARWSGDVPVLVEVDGDGVADLIGYSRYVLDGDRMHLAAYSGATGKPLWESPKLGSYSDVYQGRITAAGDVVLLATTAGAVAGFDRKTGQPRWEAQLGEKVDQLCAGEDAGTIAVATADRRWHRIALADGARRDGAPLKRSGKGACAPLPSNQRESMPGLATAEGGATVKGMRVERTARRGDGPTVAIGRKQTGTAVPMLAVVEGKAERWRAQVAATSPLDSRAEDTLVTISADAVYAVYEPPQGPPHLTAFALADGRRLWDREVQQGTTIVMTGLVWTGARVVLSSWGHLQGFDPATGAPAFLVGSL